MKFTTGIFFTIILSVLYVSNAQKAFQEVRSLLVNLKKSNDDDQLNANVREKESDDWCKQQITDAEQLVAQRQKEVDDLKEHIEFLEKTRKEAETDKKTRQDRIVSNEALLKKFKTQRCDNNLIFVKQLREIMQAVDIMGLLRADLVEYFNKKTEGTQGTAFLERFVEYSHLLDEKHKQTFVQLKAELSSLKPHKLDRTTESQKENLAKTEDLNAANDVITKEKERTTEAIGSGHVDNKQGELQKLDTPEFEKIAEFNIKTRTRVLAMIDGLIKHLKATREELTKNEIKAAEDFAVFQNAMEKEDARLVEKIAELEKEIKHLTNEITISEGQLVKRVKLLGEAKQKLALLQKMCKEKKAYFTAETKRRVVENKYIDQAIVIFDSFLKKLSERVRERVNTGKVDGKFVNEIGQRVVKSDPNVRTHVAGQVDVRNEVVL